MVGGGVMCEITAISWCDHTFNPVIGCTKVSPACDGCYAENLMSTRYGRVKWGAPGKGNGTRVRTSPANWKEPLRWNRKAEAEGRRPFVFCASLADVFDNLWETQWRRDLFDLIRATPNLVWLLLTKRPQNIVRLWAETLADESGVPVALTPDFWPRNAAIGTTVEDQVRADKNVPVLLAAKAALKPAFAFLSCEPLLGPIDLMTIERPAPLGSISALPCEPGGVYLDWVITGGETDQGGHKARPTHPDWFKSIRDQCAAFGVPFHHKQNGEWRHAPDRAHFKEAIREPWTRVWSGSEGVRPAFVVKEGKSRTGRLLDGVEHNARPEVA